MIHPIDLSPISLVTVAAILFMAGIAKGVIGIGLSSIAVPLLTLVLPLPMAIAVLAVPLFITNLAQAGAGERIGVVIRTLWPLLAGSVAGMLIGVHLLVGLSPEILKPAVGAVLIVAAALMLLTPQLSCPDRVAIFAGPLVGIGSGILGGFTGTASIVFLYLQARGVSGSRFIQYSSMYLVLSSVVLTMALGTAGAMGGAGAALSAICVVPILLGMRVGWRVRAGLSSGLFRQLVLGIVLLGGISMVEPALSTMIGDAAFLADPAAMSAASLLLC